MNNSQYSYKELVTPLISYFVSIIKEEPYQIIYDKWMVCDHLLDEIKKFVGDTDQEISYKSPLKMIIDYYRFFNLKRQIFYSDLEFNHMRDSLIDLIKYRELCLKHTVILNVFYHNLFRI